ncbi:GGDEF domain-containing protein [Verminephrobacter aporrectodeae]|uniref:GGDEF domain-containing protein n=1 Tax=Verminephrobacter aporrectodeae TaxID=1110389 RepID=UPI00224432AF|nr:GGDEF domain-containing protein [Verminephrobacter aporrectodeae]
MQHSHTGQRIIADSVLADSAMADSIRSALERSNSCRKGPPAADALLHCAHILIARFVSDSAASSLVDLRELRLDAALALLAQAGSSQAVQQRPDCTPALQELIDGLCGLCLADPLTGLSSRGHLHAVLGREIDRVLRSGESALLLMLDIDQFDAVNGTQGAAAGAALLQSVARALGACVRPMDTLARYGGAQFALLLPACQAAFGRALAERLRRAVAHTPIPTGASLRLHATLSVGGAFATQAIRSTPLLWAERARHQLCQAQSAGCDRVSIEEQPESAVSAEEKSLLFGPLPPAENS